MKLFFYLESRLPKKIKINVLAKEKNVMINANTVLLNWVIETHL